MAENWIDDESKTVKAELEEMVLTIGEKLDIRRFWLQIIRLAPSLLLCAAAGFLLTYIHAASRILEFVLHLAIFVPTAALILYAFGMNQYEKNLVAGLLRKLLRRRT